ncbi:MAG TPA: hypothetical protein VFG38_03850 [Pseudomonadales bacterium]|nr:hypothetical protein [Pseudomonadales bacterium]
MQSHQHLADLSDTELRREHIASLDLIEAAMEKTLRHATHVLDVLKSRHKIIVDELKRRQLH